MAEEAPEAAWVGRAGYAGGLSTVETEARRSLVYIYMWELVNGSIHFVQDVDAAADARHLEENPVFVACGKVVGTFSGHSRHHLLDGVGQLEFLRHPQGEIHEQPTLLPITSQDEECLNRFHRVDRKR